MRLEPAKLSIKPAAGSSSHGPHPPTGCQAPWQGLGLVGLPRRNHLPVLPEPGPATSRPHHRARLGPLCHPGVSSPMGAVEHSRGEEHQVPLQQRLRLIKDFSRVWHYSAPSEKQALAGDLTAATTSAHQYGSHLEYLCGTAGSAALSIPRGPQSPVLKGWHCQRGRRTVSCRTSPAVPPWRALPGALLAQLLVGDISTSTTKHNF